MPECRDDKCTKKGQIAAHFGRKIGINYIFKPHLEAAVPVLCLKFRVRFELKHDAHGHYPIVLARIALAEPR